MNLCFSSNQNKVIVETNKGCIVISMAMLCILQTMSHYQSVYLITLKYNLLSTGHFNAEKNTLSNLVN